MRMRKLIFTTSAAGAAANATGSKLADKFFDALSPIIDPIFSAIKRGATWLRRKLSRNPAYHPELELVPEHEPPKFLVIPAGVDA